MVKRRWPHRVARAAAWVAGVALIMLALTAGLAQVLLPMLARHPDWVAAQLSQRLHRPMSFTSMEGRWTPSGPVFVMHGVTVGLAPGEHGTPLKIPESELKLDFGGWLLPSRHLFSLHASGLQLELIRDADGWHVNGIAASGGGRQSFSPGRLSIDLWLNQLRVIVDDNVRNKHYVFSAPQLRLSRQGRHIRFGGTVKREGVSAGVSTTGRFSDDGSSGQVWFGLNAIDLKPLLDGVDIDGYTAENGKGRLQAWLDWRHGQVSSSVIRFDMDSLSLTSPSHATASVASLHGLAGLRHVADGYEVRWAGDDDSALVLSLHQPDTVQASIGVAARNLQLAPLLPWLALKPNLAPGLATWLGSGHPHGRLDHVSLQWSRSEGLRSVDAGFDEVGIDAVGGLPGVSHVHGELRGDGEALSLELPDQPTTLSFPHIFRQPFALSTLAGSIAAWQQDGDWHLGIDALDFSGTGFAGHARGDVVLPAQGGAPFMDMYATVD
ncbi:MAG: TIGR02099 family protein, partial [Betaproteobacteria bacterium]